MPCVAHLGEVARSLPELAADGIAVLAVVQAKPAVLRPFLARRPYPFPVVSDPDRTAYRAFGLGRVGWGHFLRPDVLFGYLRHLATGRRVRKPAVGEDVRQLGGDFLVSRNLRLVYAHPSRAATDRPTLAAIRAAARLPLAER